MDVKIAVPDEHVSKPILDAGLEMNTRVNEALLREGSAPSFTTALKNGVRWRPEPPGQESFDHGAVVIKRGWGDCDDLAPLRAASLRVSGRDPGAKAIAYKSGPSRWHAIVQRGDGRLEDPSQAAGMRVRPGSVAAGIPPAVVGIMATGVGINGAVRPFVAVRRTDDGYLARVDMPVRGESFAISCRQKGSTPSKALSGCMAGACVVGSEARMCSTRDLDRMWALHGLLAGASAAECARVCGAEPTKDALLTLQDIAPALVQELRSHWDDARSLREAWDARVKRRASKKAVPVHDETMGAAAGSPTGSADRGPPGSSYMPGAEVYTDEHWADHLAHERVVSPYAERFAHRGREFVGAAAGSPTGSADRGPPGSSYMPGAEVYTDEHWADHLAHERVLSPYAERFAHRGREFVGIATDSPYAEMNRVRRTWGIPRAFQSEQGASRLVRELHAEIHGFPFKPTLSFSLAGVGRAGHARRRRAKHIVHHTHFGDALDRAVRGPPIKPFRIVVGQLPTTPEGLIQMATAPQVLSSIASQAPGLLSLGQEAMSAISSAVQSVSAAGPAINLIGTIASGRAPSTSQVIGALAATASLANPVAGAIIGAAGALMDGLQSLAEETFRSLGLISRPPPQFTYVGFIKKGTTVPNGPQHPLWHTWDYWMTPKAQGWQFGTLPISAETYYRQVPFTNILTTMGRYGKAAPPYSGPVAQNDFERYFFAILKQNFENWMNANPALNPRQLLQAAVQLWNHTHDASQGTRVYSPLNVSHSGLNLAGGPNVNPIEVILTSAGDTSDQGVQGFGADSNPITVNVRPQGTTAMAIDLSKGFSAIQAAAQAAAPPPKRVINLKGLTLATKPAAAPAVSLTPAQQAAAAQLRADNAQMAALFDAFSKATIPAQRVQLLQAIIAIYQRQPNKNAAQLAAIARFQTQLAAEQAKLAAPSTAAKPMTLAAIVAVYRPEIIRHMMAVPKTVSA